MSQIATTGANSTSHTNYNLTSGATNYYRVCAYNSADNSACSNVASAQAR